MGIDRDVSGCASQTLPNPVLDVFSFRVHELLGKAKIDQKNSIFLPSSSEHQIFWFNVPVNDPVSMYELDNLYCLDGNRGDGKGPKTAPIFLQTRFKGFPQQIHSQEVLPTLRSVVVNSGNSHSLFRGVFQQPHINLAFLKKLLLF